MCFIIVSSGRSRSIKRIALSTLPLLDTNSCHAGQRMLVCLKKKVRQKPRQETP